MPSLSWLVKLYENLTYVRMRPAANALNYSVKDIRKDVCQIIYIYEKSQLNRLVWGSLTLAPISTEKVRQRKQAHNDIAIVTTGMPTYLLYSIACP